VTVSATILLTATTPTVILHTEELTELLLQVFLLERQLDLAPPPTPRPPLAQFLTEPEYLITY
jgi:hypothetical protein